MKHKIFTSLLRTALFSLSLSFLIGAGTVFAADIFWIDGDASCSHKWSDSDCWSATRHGSGGAGTPISTSTVHFTPEDTTSCEIDIASSTADSITMEFGYSGTISPSVTATTLTTNSFAQYYGTFIAPPTMSITSLFHSYYDSINDTSIFQHNNGTLEVLGSGTAEIQTGAGLYNLVINRTNSTDELILSDISLYNNFTLTKGTIPLASTGDIYINGAWTMGTDAATNFLTQNDVQFMGTRPEQTINGDTSFWNLSYIAQGEFQTLYFQAGSHQIIRNTTMFKLIEGISGFRLASTIGGSYWYFDPQGTRIIMDARISDSYNQNSTLIVTSGNRLTDLGNNFGYDGWFSTIVNQLSPTGQTGTTPTFRWEDIMGETSYTIEVRNSTDTDWNSPVMTLTSAANTTSKVASSALPAGDYTWRVYGNNSDPDEATTMNFSAQDISLVPEFNTYLYGIMLIMGGYFIYNKRKKLSEEL